MPINPNRGLAKDPQGNMLWQMADEVIETDIGPFTQRVLVGQPNAGVIHRAGPGGMAIYMYNEEPGVFYNERGAVVPVEMAQMAGFSVEPLLMAREKKMAMEEARRLVELQFASRGLMRNVVEERGNYRLVECAKGRFNVEFVEGEEATVMNEAGPMLEGDAHGLFNGLAPKEAKTAKKA